MMGGDPEALSMRASSLPRAAALLALVAFLPRPSEAAVPSGFLDELVTAAGGPTDVAFTPDRRMLVASQGGPLRIFAPVLSGGVVTYPTGTAALTFPANVLCSNSERGLLGVTVDPDFATNGFVYVYYTFQKTGTGCPTGSPNVVNRVSRFTFSPPTSNTINFASEKVLIDNMRSWGGNHNAGDLAFGKDGYLYVTVGDGGTDYAGDSGGGGANDASRDQHVLLGKVLRIDPRGATSADRIPPTNPFQGAGTAVCADAGITTPGLKCRETFAWGFRNPFRFAFDPGSVGTRFYVNDVGQNTWEEIDLAQAGADFGWNCREGAHTNSTTGKCSPTPAGMVDPIFEYRHDLQVPGTTSPASCDSITGGAFIPAGSWPTTYDNNYLFADYVCGWIFLMTPKAGGGFQATDFATSLGGSSATSLFFGPLNTTTGLQALYYTTYAGGGQIRRIRYTGTMNRAPNASMTATPQNGSAPLSVSFDASASSDPENNVPLTYIWTFGDGGGPVETSSATTAHTYGIGSFVASLRVRDALGATSDPVTLAINAGNSPPVPSIQAPTTSVRYRVGQNITLTGQASDPDQGTLPDNALSWTVILHHNTHTHPFLGPVSGNNIDFTTPPPEDLDATATSFLEIRLTATDAAGAAVTITQDLLPNKVNVTFATAPTGLRLDVNGASIVAPQTFVSWESYVLNVNAPPQLDGGGVQRVFSSWSDGGASSHAITTPNVSTTYTATFAPGVVGPDLNGDGKADLLWWHQTQGVLYAWFLNGVVQSGGSFLSPAAAATSWHVEAVADLDGDARPDLVWRHQTTGLLYAWLLNGVNQTSSGYLTPGPVTDTNWKIEGIGDLNGDGKNDLLWRHQTTGSLYAWFMDDLDRIGASALTPGGVSDTNWKIEGVGDFDNDGRPDILWRHQTTGFLYVWFMNGTTQTGGSYLTPNRVIDTNWHVEAVADVNGDQKPDLVWRHQTSGSLYAWYLNGVVQAGGSYLTPSQVTDVNWKIVSH